MSRRAKLAPSSSAQELDGEIATLNGEIAELESQLALVNASLQVSGLSLTHARGLHTSTRGPGACVRLHLCPDQGAARPPRGRDRPGAGRGRGYRGRAGQPATRSAARGRAAASRARRGRQARGGAGGPRRRPQARRGGLDGAHQKNKLSRARYEELRRGLDQLRFEEDAARLSAAPDAERQKKLADLQKRKQKQSRPFAASEQLAGLQTAAEVEQASCGGTWLTGGEGPR